MTTVSEQGALNSSLICYRCQEYLGVVCAENGSSAVSCCTVCLGLWNDCAQVGILQSVEEACMSYGGIEVNRFSRHHPVTVAIPGDIAFRYHLASTLESSFHASPFHAFHRDLKDHLKAAIVQRFQDSETESRETTPHFDEEQGYLCVHVILTTSPGNVSRPPRFMPPKSKTRTRKRFRGHDPTEKQGGDPRTNLEKRMLKQNIDLWTASEVQSVLDQGVLPGTMAEWSSWFRGSAALVPTQNPVQYHVAVWRRSFFVRGLYTKSRRDVSQTPFYVPTEANKSVMKRMGVTSVEEEITPVLSELACRGMSTLNNDPEATDVVYGMIKFHASGREDMNVRMLLPPDLSTEASGRPFVCQVVDALRMPSVSDLVSVQDAINGKLIKSHRDVYIGDNIASRVYGCNPKGVGIDHLSFAPASSFRNLQGETEEKVKFYGCLCWCQDAIDSQDELSSRLGRCPIQLQQRTPIRVLHRRANTTRVRHILTLRGTRVDSHYFRLNLSTDAGTYVKEFVHGDLGRTVPSVSSLLGSKTDILELDCEGIQGV